MNGNLTDFLVNLASDPDLLARFVADPGGEMSRARLTESEKAAILSRDSLELRRALGLGLADHMTHVLTPSGARKGAKKRKAARKRPASKKRPAKGGKRKTKR
jgi:hypothetical protein